jgi:hypothetical protein
VQTHMLLLLLFLATCGLLTEYLRAALSSRRCADPTGCIANEPNNTAAVNHLLSDAASWLSSVAASAF